MRQRQIRIGFVLATLCLLVAHAAFAADRLDGRIQKYKESAASARDALVGLMTELEQLPAFIKVDGPIVARHFEDIARTWDDAATALEKGDEGAAAALALRAEEMTGKRDRWQERLRWRTLQSQNEYLPATAEIYFLLAPEHNGGLTKEVEAFLETKKQRSEAYGRLAEATTPTAPRETLRKLQDEVFALDVEVWVADMKYTWAREDWDFRTWVATDPKVASPELTAAKERVIEWRRQREQAYRQSRSQQHALEQLDRESADLLTARDKAYRSAKAAQKPSTNN